MPSVTGQTSSPVDPIDANESGEGRGDDGKDVFRDIDRTPETTVRRVLKQSFLARQKRGAISANVETEMRAITKDTEQQIDDVTERLRGDKSRGSRLVKRVFSDE